jgi:hypothetical protein
MCVERVKVVTVVRDRSLHGDDGLQCCDPRAAAMASPSLERCLRIRAEPDLTGPTSYFLVGALWS